MRRLGAASQALTLYIVPLAIFMLAILVISIVLRVMIAIEAGWKDTSGLYKTSLILWAVSLVTAVPFASEITFLVDQRRLNHVETIDRAWCGLYITWWVLFYGTTFAELFGQPFVVRKAWMDTFHDDWPQTQTFTYRATIGLLAPMARVARWQHRKMHVVVTALRPFALRCSRVLQACGFRVGRATDRVGQGRPLGDLEDMSLESRHSSAQQYSQEDAFRDINEPAAGAQNEGEHGESEEEETDGSGDDDDDGEFLEDIEAFI